MKCTITVGETTEEFEVPDNLLSAPYADQQQDSATQRAVNAFSKAYIVEIGRQRAERLHPGILEGKP